MTNEREASENEQPIGKRTGCTLQQSHFYNSLVSFPKIKAFPLFLSFGSWQVNVAWIQQRRDKEYMISHVHDVVRNGVQWEDVTKELLGTWVHSLCYDDCCIFMLGAFPHLYIVKGHYLSLIKKSHLR